MIPGLKLSLFPHQLTSVWWMLSKGGGGSRYGVGSRIPNPCFRTLATRHKKVRFFRQCVVACTSLTLAFTLQKLTPPQ